MKTKTHFITKFLIDALFVLCIAALVTLPLWMRKYQEWLCYSDSQYYYIMVMLFAAGILTAYILFTLDRMYKTLTSGDPFVTANVNAFRRIAVACAAIALIFIAKCFIVFSLATVIVVVVFIVGCLFCLTLKELFEKAVYYKEENDFTV